MVLKECRCPGGYTGSSCESCSAGFYHTITGLCERCPCSNREESCQLGSDGSVICNCQPLYRGSDCSIGEIHFNLLYNILIDGST